MPENAHEPQNSAAAAFPPGMVGAIPAEPAPNRTAVLELRVRNHPGAMSHICGLFARRAFNLEAIVCAPNPADGGATSSMLLLVAEEPRLEQVERQLEKLHDVLAVRHREDLDPQFFGWLAASVPPAWAAEVPA